MDLKAIVNKINLRLGLGMVFGLGCPQREVMCAQLFCVVRTWRQPAQAAFLVDAFMSYLDLYDSPSGALPERLSIAGQDQNASRSGSRGKRLSLQLSSDLHRRLKLIALEDEETMNSLVIGVLRRFVAEREEQVSRLRR